MTSYGLGGYADKDKLSLLHWGVSFFISFSLNALRKPHSAKPHKRISFTCPLGDRPAVSKIDFLAVIFKKKVRVLAIVSTRTY